MKILRRLVEFGREFRGVQRPTTEDRSATESGYLASQNQSTDPPTISIVTPTFNSEAFLNQTISSVVGQPGPFFLSYHIQDGCSTDRTLEIVRNWQALIIAGFPIGCLGIEFTVTSEPDSGMYQAINRGFSKLPLTDSALMTWINSDDLLAPGAIMTAIAVLQDVGVPWLSGRSALIDERGCIIDVFADNLFSREDLQRGLYVGRGRPFVMQEGSFWRPWLWFKAGGVDESFRLAGDWDLWRRFARFVPLYSVRTVLGFHRKRDGQLSQDMNAYYAEVDATICDVTDIAELRKEQNFLIAYNLNNKKWEAG